MDTTQDTIAGNIDVQHLVPQASGGTPLTAQTPVLCVHRGRRVTVDGAPVRHPQAARGERLFLGDIKDTYDSKHYVIEPGYFTTEYGAALHFKARAVVPGSRNPETGRQASFIAILGVAVPQGDGTFKITRKVDDRAQWDPFTDEECGEYEIAFEALDRGGMVNPIAAEVTLVNTGAVVHGGKAPVSRVKGGSGAGGVATGGKGKSRATRIEADNAEILAPVDPSQHEALKTMAADKAEVAAGGR